MTAPTSSASTALQNVKPLKTVESRPAVSNWVIIWATFASAVGETKLALSAIFVVAERYYALSSTSGGRRVLEVIGGVRTRTDAVNTRGSLQPLIASLAAQPGPFITAQRGVFAALSPIYA